MTNSELCISTIEDCIDSENQKNAISICANSTTNCEKCLNANKYCSWNLTNNECFMMGLQGSNVLEDVSINLNTCPGNTTIVYVFVFLDVASQPKKKNSKRSFKKV